ncbi:M48 family metallopeptidase [Cognatiyoonia sp. IB215182]|uniref:M48 family metallopeptidase n=1 Tax=Cognatiyoonia sp. IB215182 TaxID=3097353 RepID=UPI002A0F81FC|nr:M48 family metallopeptidase [Cognatiyoonia sp. IB215182]MDX8351764.1 M48 family metallopeptidase [Cognatiyoonia sp. IB215182]
MIAANWWEERKRAQGEQVFLDALRDYAGGTLDAKRHGLIGAQILSVLILATPFAVALCGVALILSTLPSWGGVFFGAVLIAAGYVLLPARYRVPKDALTRDKAPILFAQMDKVSDALSAPRISHVAVTEEFNAFVTKTGGKTVLGIGGLLWEAASANEKRALVAHEIAHLVNNDPARGQVIRYALDTLARWEDLVAPDWHGNVFADIALLPFRLLIAALEQALLRMMFLQSQRAEYLADALAAKVAGSDAIASLLNTSSLASILETEWNKIHGMADVSGRAVLRRLVVCLTDMDAERRATLLAQNDQEKLSVDVTHPPNAYRRAFVDTIAPDEVTLSPSLFDEEDPALDKALHRIGEKLAVHFDAQ